METKLLRDYRCNCNRLLFKGFIEQAHIEIKCRRCSAITKFGIVGSVAEKGILYIQDAPDAGYASGASLMP